jgi:hypothetical protein
VQVRSSCQFGLKGWEFEINDSERLPGHGDRDPRHVGRESISSADGSRIANALSLLLRGLQDQQIEQIKERLDGNPCGEGSLTAVGQRRGQ